MLAASAGAAPRCFGAAARDPQHRCANPRLARVVTPTPDEALLDPNFPCTKRKLTPAATECAFGAPAERATATVALIGDSHAQHWRSALAVPAERRGWRVLDVSGPLCMFSTATTGAGPPFDQACGQWNADVLAWLGAHPEIHTIFTAGKRRQFVRPAPGQSGFDARREGYKGRWATLPSTVTSIVVIRDAPPEDVRTKDCVRRRIARHRTAHPGVRGPTPACAAPRPRRRGRARVRRARDRPHAAVLRRAPLLSGDRRRARAQGRRPPDAGVRAHARAVHGPRLRRLDDQQHARADGHQRRGHLPDRSRRARRTRRGPWRARACCRRRAGRSGAARGSGRASSRRSTGARRRGRSGRRRRRRTSAAPRRRPACAARRTRATPASARFSAACAVRSASISSERTVPPTASAASPSQIVE